MALAHQVCQLEQRIAHSAVPLTHPAEFTELVKDRKPARTSGSANCSARSQAWELATSRSAGWAHSSVCRSSRSPGTTRSTGSWRRLDGR